MGSAGLGKLVEFLLDALLMLGDSATDRELAIAVGRESRVRDVRACLDKLVEENILKRSGNRYYRHQDTGWELQFTRNIYGELERDERQKEKHQRDREGNRNALEASEVPRQDEEKKSREKLAKIKDHDHRLKKEQREADRAAFSRKQAATRYPRVAYSAEGIVVGEEEPLPEPPEESELEPLDLSLVQTTPAIPADTTVTNAKKTVEESLELFASTECRTWNDPDDDRAMFG